MYVQCMYNFSCLFLVVTGKMLIFAPLIIKYGKVFSKVTKGVRGGHSLYNDSEAYPKSQSQVCLDWHHR